MSHADSDRFERISTPLGTVSAWIDTTGRLTCLSFHDPEQERPGSGPECRGIADPIRRQLTEFFGRERRRFDLDLAPRGTAFQQRVWSALLKIPYGATISYGQLAEKLGDPKLTRAVGLANGANPIAIVIPCHRVIGSSGKLVGYGGGLERKRALLDLEAGVARLPLSGAPSGGDALIGRDLGDDEAPLA